MKGAFQVGDRWVGWDKRVFIIAECGSNHDQKLSQAKQLIEAAADAGADAIKFQVFAAEDLYAPDSPLYDAVKSVELPREWLPALSNYAATYGLLFFASAFSREAVDCLEAVNVPAHKCASSETVNLPLLKYMASTKKPVFLSTGMCDLADVHEAVETIRSEGNETIALLQCTALYPTEPQHVHLRAMDTLRESFQLPVGFSDHTLDIVIPVAAVARGACVIEKHLTLSRTLAGPDHSYAMELADFKRMVQAIRSTEQALGSPVKHMLAGEAKFARRDSLRAARDIAAGEVLTPEMVAAERPGDGIRPRYLGAVMGQRVAVSLQKGEAITWSCLTSDRAMAISRGAATR